MSARRGTATAYTLALLLLGACSSRSQAPVVSDRGPGSGEGDAGAEAFWASGTDGLDRSYAQDFATFRGRALSSAWVNVHWLEWDWLTAPGLLSSITGDDRVKVWNTFADWPGVLALAMSMAGSSNVSQDVYNANMHQCADGEYDDSWRTFAANAAAAGRTGADTVVSLAHEFNGTWFPWHPSEDVSVETWLSCWRHVYSAIKSASDLRVIWVFSASANTEKGGDYAVDSAWDAYPGDDYVDVIGVDRYDFRALGTSQSRNWRDSCGNSQDLCNAARYARAHGKPLGIPEWSIERGQYGDGDDPLFIDLMYGFFRDNRDVLMFENIFNNGGEGDWYLYPTDSHNAKSSARYQELWSSP